ncbi:MAG: iron dependent repressor, metal binding and dimerization domain protein [Bacteroidota bacterium]
MFTEVFLINKLGFGWEEIHAIAELLEHTKNETLTGRPTIFLDYLKADPLGISDTGCKCCITQIKICVTFYCKRRSRYYIYEWVLTMFKLS